MLNQRLIKKRLVDMRFLLFFIIYSFLEVSMFVISGHVIGILYTVLLVIVIGLIGFIISRAQGASLMKNVFDQIRRGEMPTDTLFDGLCIIVGSILLVIPGFVSDFLALLFLIPFTRKYLKPIIFRFISRRKRVR